MTEVDLNSDMGEGFGPWTIGDGVDAAIMPLISSANIATRTNERGNHNRHCDPAVATSRSWRRAVRSDARRS